MPAPTRSTVLVLGLLLAPLAWVPLSACGDKDDEEEDDDDPSSGGRAASAPTDCDGRPVSDASELATQLQIIGYGDFSSDSGGTDTGHSSSGWIIQDAETWAALVETIDDSVSLTPDFDVDVVFVNPWADGGCAEPYQYDAFRWDDTVRLRRFQPGRDNCDAHFPQLDIILVEDAADASDLGFCP